MIMNIMTISDLNLLMGRPHLLPGIGLLPRRVAQSNTWFNENGGLSAPPELPEQGDPPKICRGP